MVDAFLRTQMLIGSEALEKLKNSIVAIFGIGGVGSFVAEGLARSGIGSFVLIDNDIICETNLNRQIHATIKTVGKPKVEVMKERILEINPMAKVESFQIFYDQKSSEQLITDDYNYIIDAIDTVTSKIEIILKAKEKNIPVISSMGMGNKIYPSMIELEDLFNTSICPLAKVMRKELRKRTIDSLKVVYSKEIPIKPLILEENHQPEAVSINIKKRQTLGSMSFVPSVAGLLIAAEVVRDIIDFQTF